MLSHKNLTFYAFVFVAKKLNLYQVLAPNVSSSRVGFVPILRKNVHSKVHEVRTHYSILTTLLLHCRGSYVS